MQFSYKSFQGGMLTSAAVTLALGLVNDFERLS